MEQADLWIFLLGVVMALCVKSLLVLGSKSPMTSIGWYGTALYCLDTIVELLAKRPLPFHLPYLALVVVVAGFAIAGFRDEAQAEPWWWPTRLGLTRAEKRAKR